MIVLSLCDRTGNMVQPWIEAGYEAITVDLQESPTANPKRHHFVVDVTNWRYPLKFGPPAIVFAFPPCTHLAVSGARWFKEKGLPALIGGLQIVNACREICESSGAPWMLENPVGTLASYWREPDYTFDPCDYGDPYTKKTCLWVGGGFVMPPKVTDGDMFRARYYCSARTRQQDPPNAAVKRSWRLAKRDPDGICAGGISIQ